MKKIIHWITILGIFLFVGVIGYFTYQFAINIDGKKNVDNSLQEKSLATTKNEDSDYEEDKTKSDLKGKKVELKMNGDLKLDEGSWDFICEEPKVNLCAGSMLKITSPDDPNFQKTHPINEYIVITGDKKYKYKIDLNTNNAKGLYLRKRANN